MGGLDANIAGIKASNPALAIMHAIGHSALFAVLQISERNPSPTNTLIVPPHKVSAGGWSPSNAESIKSALGRIPLCGVRNIVDILLNHIVP